VNWREAARSGEWAQHFSNASCSISGSYYFYGCNLVETFLSLLVAQLKLLLMINFFAGMIW